MASPSQWDLRSTWPTPSAFQWTRDELLRLYEVFVKEVIISRHRTRD